MVYDKQHMIHFAFLLFLMFLLFFEPTFQQQDSPSSSRAERAALLELRSSLGLRTKEWPIKLHPCIGWKGIKCINGSVTDINIAGFRRTSIGRKNPQFAVESLANLTLLQSFNASNFILPGVIPEWFGHHLSLLQVLDLRSCSIFGSIPSSLASLRHLSRLDLSSNYLSGSIPPGVGSLLKLRYLNLSKNMLSSSIPAQLGGLVSLLDLDLSVNSLSGTLPLELRGLTSLRSMVLRSNSLDGSLSDGLFRTLTRLQSLDLKDNNFTGLIPDGLWSMSGLQLLDVSRNSFTGLLPNYSSSFNITDAVLSVSQNAFYGSLTIILRRFSVIDLSGNYFEGNVPDYLPTHVSFVSNCLQNVSRQRTLAVCTSFYSARGLIFGTFGFLEPTEHPIAEVSSKKSNRNGVILGSVIGGSVVIFLIVLLILIFLWRRKRRTTNRRRGVVGPVLPSEAVEPTPRLLIDYPTFKYDELVQASNGFSDLNLVKHGHSGDFFYGVLQNGIRVVIKRVDLRRANDGYLVELELLSKVSNVRLVPFIGQCLENENEKFLVYKFLPNGDLSASLFKKVMSDEECLQSLDWITRLKIALGAAEGLCFLHHDCTPPLVHRDVQASSILLDDKFEVRLGSLSHVCGQQGEAQPSRSSKLLRLPQSSEEASLGLQTAVCTYDVYCFGKVLLELVTGKLGVSAVPDAEINEWLDQTLPCININNKELVTKILDPSLIVDDDLLEEAWAVAVVAKSCLNPKPSRRPVMKYILKALENPLKVVREENSSSRQFRSTSIGSSWNASLFGSWHQSLSDVTMLPSASLTKAGGSSFKRSRTMGSQGSDRNGGSERSSSRRRHSKEIFPEPAEVQGIERLENK
ncbi:probable LRR receptor-like serine/threonine-protein kinase At2g16250 [Cucurbita moschata]|uniref:Probable LRR receptor-like serine/threonine-protein kinase At2g16250 n=1 Tax=Cucurbita moschata TaxID=3662 RepID=A0A6J1ENP7_CUCMO|nr:probable LRR receptor-like serine/threonine-protein kinase At2g16250 [Cucurbita moschata]